MPRTRVIVRFVAIALVLAAPPMSWDSLAAQSATPGPIATPVASGATEYVDPSGRFIVPIPTGWTAATVGEVGLLTSPEGGIAVYALAIPGTEIPKALDQAWHIVDPAFDLTPGETLEVPATAGLPPFTVTTYEGGSPDEAVQAIAQLVDETVFAILVRADLEEAARRASQLQTAALGLQVTGVAELSLEGVAARKLTPAKFAEVDAFVGATMERYGIPGAAYAVVQRRGDRPRRGVRGHGTRRGRALVTSQTMMPVASVTKPMTTTYMAALVDDGADALGRPPWSTSCRRLRWPMRKSRRG